MNQRDVELFIEVMKSIGDDWSPEQVMEKYGHLTLREAVEARKNALNPFFEYVENVIAKDLEDMSARKEQK